MTELGLTYRVEGGTPVTFERLPASVIENRVDAYSRYLNAFEGLLPEQADAD
ncbi:hypothetical protein D3C76_1838050 [compost metagenome]